MAERGRRAVACKTEIMQFLTEVMRGEVQDGREPQPPKVSERTKAAELLGKSQHIFGERAAKSKAGSADKLLEVRIWGEEEL